MRVTKAEAPVVPNSARMLAWSRECGGCKSGDASAIPIRRVPDLSTPAPGSVQRDYCGGTAMPRHRSHTKTKTKNNRRARKDPLVGLPPLNLNAAGIDVGATQHYVAIPEGRSEVSVRQFRSFTNDLYRLADWLIECGIETVVMEA